MTRSKSGILVSTGCRASVSLRAVDALATVTPCDDESENQVQRAEADAEQHVGDGERREDRAEAEEHETDAHHRHDADGERAAADERRAVEQQPGRRHRAAEAD